MVYFIYNPGVSANDVSEMRYNSHRRREKPKDRLSELIDYWKGEIDYARGQIAKSRAAKKWNKGFNASRRRFLKRGFVGCVIAALPADMLLCEPHNIELTTYYVPLPNLPADLDGLRIVQLSDLHRGPITPDSIIAKSVSIARSTHPDIALLTGDFVTADADNATPVAEMLSDLKPRLGSYGCLGNHDYTAGANAVRSVMEKHGIRMLVNENVRLGEGVFLVGLDDAAFGKPDVGKAYDGIGQNSHHITIAHNPIAARTIKNRNGLLLSGHTHGGQVRLPFLPIHTVPGLVAGKYFSGWYLDSELRTYVNRGIGMTNLPIRFLCRPEVTLFVLERTAGDSQ